MGTNIRLAAPFQPAPDPLDELLGPSDRPGSNLETALAHAKAGRPVFPCRDWEEIVDDELKKRKSPLVGWTKAATTDEDQIRWWWGKWPGALPAIPMGRASGLAVLDLDRKDGKDGVAELRALGFDPDTLSPVSIATPSGGRHVYVRWREGIGTNAGQIAPGVDVRGEGGYVIAPGATGAAGTYSPADPVPADLPEWPASLPTGRPAAPRRETPPEDDLLAEWRTAPLDLSEAEVDGILADLPPIWAHDRVTWRNVGMALHHQYGGSEKGFAKWGEWSQQDGKYDPKTQKSSWKSFKEDPRQGAYTIRSLIKEVNRIRKERESVDALNALLGVSAPEIVDLDDPLDALPGEAKPTAPASPLTFLSPAECAQSEPRRYIVKGLIAERDVACIVGAPGAGKSVLAPALAYAVAQGREAHGRRTRAGGVFYVAAEDEHGMRGRVTALRSEHGDAENFTLVGGVSDLLNEAVAGQGSPHFNVLLKAVEERRPSLIVIDTLSMSFPGLEENSAEGMGRVVHVARSLTQWGAAVLLIHHDSKDSNNGLPRGHSLLNGALDVSIHLRKEDDGTVRGRLTKNRNGACDVQLAFSVRGVEIGRDEDGETVTAPLCVPLNPNALKQAGPRLKPSERWALESIRKLMGDGDNLDLATWRAKARDDGRITRNETPDGRRMAVNRALQGLERHGIVRVVDGTIEIDDGIEWQFDDLSDDGEGDQ